MFPCHLNQTHLIQNISSLVETPRPELGVSDKGEMQNVQCWGASRNVIGNHWTRAHEGRLRRVCCVTLLTDSDLQVLQRRHTRGRRQHRLPSQSRTVTHDVPAGVHKLHLQHKTHQYHEAALLIGCSLQWPRELNALQIKKRMQIKKSSSYIWQHTCCKYSQKYLFKCGYTNGNQKAPPKKKLLHLYYNKTMVNFYYVGVILALLVSSHCGLCYLQSVFVFVFVVSICSMFLYLYLLYLQSVFVFVFVVSICSVFLYLY